MRRGREHSTEGEAATVLDAVATSLRSGGSVHDGLETASLAGGPLAFDVWNVLARAELSSLRDSLDTWRRAQRAPAVRLAASAMVIALDTGGAQASMLESVSRRIRERAKIERDIRVAAASARASAAVIAATPAAFAAVVLLLDPSVVVAALRSPLGRVCVVLGLLLEVLGARWMRRLVDARSRHAADGDDGVAEVADLMSLALGAGLTTSAAVGVVAPQLDGVAGLTLRVSAARLQAGHRFVDEVSTWVREGGLGPDARPLVEVLVAAHDDGAPCVDALDQLSTDLRHAQRQRVSEQVQRLPVLLLFPLVGCILPAFVLLAVMPIAVGSLTAMRGG